MAFVYIDSVPFPFLSPRFGQAISNAITSNLWPLVVVSHQMTVRDATPLSSEQLDGLASRVQSS